MIRRCQSFLELDLAVLAVTQPDPRARNMLNQAADDYAAAFAQFMHGGYHTEAVRARWANALCHGVRLARH